MEEQLFAYSLCQVEQGWTWSLWDEDGGVVAAGAAPDQPSAQRCLSDAIQQMRATALADRRLADRKPADRKDGRDGQSLDPCGRLAASGRLARRRKHIDPPAARIAPARALQHQGL